MKKIIFILLISSLMNIYSFDFKNKEWTKEEVQSFLDGQNLHKLFLRKDYLDSIKNEQIRPTEKRNGYLFFINLNMLKKTISPEYYFGKENINKLKKDIFISNAENKIKILYSDLTSDPRDLFDYLIFTDEDGKQFTKQSLRYWPVEETYEKLKNPKLYRNIILEAMAAIFKIHLQVEFQYLPNFVESLRQRIGAKPILRDNIIEFKVVYEAYADEIFFDYFPVIVIYLETEYKTFEDRKKMMTQVIESLDELINDFCVKNGITKDELQLKDESINVIPRYNTQIKNLIYIAGGNSDYKDRFFEFQKNKNIPNTVFTDDFVFFKGFEFYKKDYEEEKSKLIKELENRVKELEKEVSKLEKF